MQPTALWRGHGEMVKWAWLTREQRVWLTSFVNEGGEGTEGMVVKVTGSDQSLFPAALCA